MAGLTLAAVMGAGVAFGVVGANIATAEDAAVNDVQEETTAQEAYTTDDESKDETDNDTGAKSKEVVEDESVQAQEAQDNTNRSDEYKEDVLKNNNSEKKTKTDSSEDTEKPEEIIKNSADTADDKEAPVVKSIMFDKTTAKPGDVVTVTADVSDASKKYNVVIRFCKESSVKENHETGKEIFYYYLNLAQYSDGTVKNQFTVDEEFENGTYEIYHVEATDIHGNTFSEYVNSDASPSFKTNKITISDSVGDNSGPKVTDVTYDKTRVKPGDKLNVNVTAHDANGVDYVNVIVQNKETGLTKTFTCKPDKNGKIRAEIAIDNSFDNGIYEISYNCEAADTLGFKSSFQPYDLNGYPNNVSSFEVYNSKESFLTIKEIKYDKTTVKPGDWVTITAYTEGANDGDTIRLTVGFIGEDFYNNVELKQQSTNVFTGKFRIYDSWLYSNNGHDVDSIFIKDSKGNEKELWSADSRFPDIKRDKLNVVNDGEVYTKPVLKSILFNKEYAEFGDEIEVTAELENAEKVEYVDVRVEQQGWGTGAWEYSDESGLGMANLRLYRGNDGLFRGNIKVTYEGELNQYDTFLYIFSAEVVTDKTYDLYYHWDDEYFHNIDSVKTNKVFIVAPKNIEENMITYANTQGDGATYTAGSGEPLEFVFKRNVNDEATFTHFSGVSVDTIGLTPDQYLAEAGSVVVTLKPEYMATLDAGEHTLTALFDDGNDVSVKFTILAQAEDEPTNQDKSTTPAGDSSEDNKSDAGNNSKDTKTAKASGKKKSSVKSGSVSAASTGDNNIYVAWIIAAIVTVASAGVTAVVLKKKADKE